VAKNRIKVGPYELLVSESADDAYRLSIRSLESIGTSREKFVNALDLLRGEFNQGYVPEDAVCVPDEPDTYAFTVHGVRLHIKVDEELMDLVIIRVYPFVGAT
jgi:hypothetical protein